MKKTIIIILVILAILAVACWLFWPKVSWSEVKKLVTEESKRYETPDKVYPILIQACKEIVTDQELFKMAKIYAKDSGVSIESVVVSSAVSQAISYGYLASA